MSFKCFKFASVILIPVLMTASGAAQGDRDEQKHPRTTYFTVGDSQDLLWTPLESKASIEDVFEVLHDRYRVSRVWWRGGQDEIWGKQFVLREQNRRYSRVWQWWKDLQYLEVGTNPLAVKAAHKRGMEIWMAYGLFDNGSGPDVGFGGFPYAAEDKIRIKHPEWIPVNKYGTWRQGGPIEFCYPGARKAMVDYLSRYVIDRDFDGIAFLTYVENYSQRYEDEFGYNQPIVDEFKKRHGIDIRHEAFNKQAWAKLRGEYLTQFMRELHAAMAKKGKKIAVSVDGSDPHWPCLWNVDNGVRTVGKLWLDLETWAKEGIVDEINLYSRNTEVTLQQVVDICKGTRAKVSAFKARGNLPEGTLRIMTVNFELESGYDWENWIDWPDENITLQPPDALKSQDLYARRRLLHAVQKRKQVIPVADIIPVTKDPDVFLRRAALRALGTLKDASAIPAVEAALQDPENSVRWQAAMVLVQLDAPDCLRQVIEAAARKNSTYQFNFVAVPQVLRELKDKKRFGPDELALLISKATDPDAKLRETIWHSLRSLNPPHTKQLEETALHTLKSDPNAYARELSLGVLGMFEPSPNLIREVTESMRQDKDPVVQVRAASALATLARLQQKAQDAQTAALGELVSFFHKYGKESHRADKDWGWRELGNAIMGFGSPGKEALESLMTNPQDTHLAELAWRVVYLRQEDKFCFITEEQDREAHARRPANLVQGRSKQD